MGMKGPSKTIIRFNSPMKGHRGSKTIIRSITEGVHLIIITQEDIQEDILEDEVEAEEGEEEEEEVEDVDGDEEEVEVEDVVKHISYIRNSTKRNSRCD